MIQNIKLHVFQCEEFRSKKSSFFNILLNSLIHGFRIFRRRRQDLFNSMGSMYSAVLFIGAGNAMTVQPVVSIERTVFYRERAAGMYSALPYAFGQVNNSLFHKNLLTYYSLHPQ